MMPGLALSGLLVVPVAVAIWAWPFTVDDAFIIFDYAERVASGQGYTRVPGPATDGVTGPLWLLVLLPFAVAGIPLDPVAKLLGLLATVAAILCLGKRLRDAQGGRGALLFYGAFIAGQLTLGIWAIAGLETGLACLLATAGTAACIAKPVPRLRLLMGVSAAMLWTRPELVPFMLVLLWRASKRAPAEARRAWIVMGLSAALLLAWRMWLFGAALPLSYYAKSGEQPWGMIYGAQGVFVTTGLFGLLLAARAVSAGGWRERTLAGALVIHVLSVVVAGGDWMPGFRLFIPIVPTFAYLCARGLRHPRRGGLWKTVGLGMVLVSGMILMNEAGEARASGLLRERVARPFAERLGRDYQRVALLDAGFLPHAGGFEAFDLAGITEPVIAHLEGGHLRKRVRGYHLRQRGVDAIVLHSVREPQVDDAGRLSHLWGHATEQRLARDVWIRARFRVAEVLRYRPGYYYVVLARQPEPAD